MAEEIKQVLIEQEMKDSYLDYSMSVIVGRALPDVKDGLKPVHRRILYAMHEAGTTFDKQFKKCANTVGLVLGKYHPHGNVAVYDALVRMVQPFSLRYPLIAGHGNFGSTEFRAAAERYTEAKLAKIAEAMLEDINKNTVDFMPNFDGTSQEPIVLPAKLPNLLVNGSSGIAVGMATNIPPHNIKEICSAAIALIENPEIKFEELISYVKGPDFPTGGIICGSTGIKLAYKTGKGKVILRAKTEIEEGKIIITEIPYQVNKSTLLEDTARLVQEKTIEGISDIRDESDREGMRIVIELKRDTNSDVILNQLFKHTALQTTFGVNVIALVDGEPRQLSLRDCLDEYLKHRFNVVTRRCKFDLDKAEKRAHILDGLLIALSDIDTVIKLIKASKAVEDARKGLITNYKLTEEQANAILDMRLQRLTSLETAKIKEEHEGLLKFIKELKEILASPLRINAIMKDELVDLKNTYGDERRTLISDVEMEDIDIEDLIDEEDVVITITNKGYVKRVPLDTYREQRRGGKGLVAAGTREEDFIEDLFICSTHSYLLCFTDNGVVHWLKAYNIPEGSRYAKGSAIINLLSLNKDDKITAIVPVNKFEEGKYLVMATKNGVIKKTDIMEYSRPRKGGIIGIDLREGDSLVDVRLTDGKKEIIIATKDGRAVRFNEVDVRAVARGSIGVRGINVRKSFVVGMEVVDNKYLLTVTEKGYGKRSLIEDYRLINRGGSGVTNIKITDKNGKVVSVKVVGEDDGIMFITKSGVVIRTNVNQISVIGRNTQGLRLMRLDEGDEVVSVAKIVEETNGD